MSSELEYFFGSSVTDEMAYFFCSLPVSSSENSRTLSPVADIFPPGPRAGGGASFLGRARENKLNRSVGRLEEGRKQGNDVQERMDELRDEGGVCGREGVEGGPEGRGAHWGRVSSSFPLKEQLE